MTINEWAKKQKSKKRNTKFYEKKYEHAKDVFNEYKFSDKSVESIKKLQKNYKKDIFDLQTTVQKIVE